MTGWQYLDQCLPDVAAVSAAVRAMYPMFKMIDTGSVNYFYSAYGSTVTQLSSPADVLVLRINPAQNYSGSGSVTRASHTYSFPQCDPAATSAICVPSSSTIAPCPSGFAPQGQEVGYSYTQAGSIFAFFFCFVLGLWVVAKNAGLILEAIRKW